MKTQLTLATVVVALMVVRADVAAPDLASLSTNTASDAYTWIQRTVRA